MLHIGFCARIRIALRLTAVVAEVFACGVSYTSTEDAANVAVAANFTEPAKAPAELFQHTNRVRVPSFGSTRQLLTQITYVVIVARCMRLQTAYSPEFEGRLFHVVLPLGAYAALALSAFTALSQTREALFGVAAAALLLLVVGIHNAWDAVTYHVFVKTKHNERHQ